MLILEAKYKKNEIFDFRNPKKCQQSRRFVNTLGDWLYSIHCRIGKYIFVILIIYLEVYSV